MTVGELRKKLANISDDVEIVMQKDKDGWYSIDEIETVEPAAEDESLMVTLNCLGGS